MLPVLHDTVTLRHFAAVSQLDLLRKQHGQKPEPRWTEGVKVEICRAVKAGRDHCKEILKADWLGAPAAPNRGDMKQIVELQVGMNQGNSSKRKNYGEAECIYFAEKYQGQVATDDTSAYAFAAARESLGASRVIDSIDILRSAVSSGSIDRDTAAKIAGEMQAKCRHFRSVHPKDLDSEYFWRAGL